jgi:AsmA protein
MKPIKLAVVSLCVILALGAALIAWFVTTIDSARLKSGLTRLVQEKLQRTLTIDGDLDLSFWPQLGIRLGKASLSEYRSPVEFAAIDGARVALALRPLLDGRIVVDNIELDGVRARLIRRRDGSLNIADLLAADASTGAARQIDIAAGKIAGARLTWLDEASGRQLVVADINLTSGAIAVDTGKQSTAVTALAAAAKVAAGHDVLAVRVDAPRLSIEPGQLRGERLTVTAQLAGAGRRIAANLALPAIEGKDGTLTIDRFDGSIDLADAKLPLQRAKLPLAGQLRIEPARQAARGTLASRLDESRIALTFDVAKFSPLALGFDLDIDQLNLDRYLPPDGAADSSRRRPDTPFDLSALKGLDIHGAIRIGRLRVRRVEAEHIVLQVDTAHGQPASPHISRGQR